MPESILSVLSNHFRSTFAALGFPEKFGRVIKSDRPDLAPFQCNGALAVANRTKKLPRDIATQIVKRLQNCADIDSLEIAGPGFINVIPAAKLFTDRINTLSDDGRAGAGLSGAPEKIVIDFGGPNVAKPMHIGHLRSSVIGDSLQRVLRFRGHEVISDIHLGDWGLQMGHLITELQDEQPYLPYFDAGLTSGYPEKPPVDIDELARLYPQASVKARADTDRMARSRQATSELQAGRAGYRALLDHLINVSIAAIKVDFDALGVHFDLWNGEATVDRLIQPMVEQFKADGYAVEDNGALIIRVAEETDKKDVPPLILVSRAGAALYATTDLATILDRRDSLAPDTILYVVDLGQSSHFEQVFRAAGRTGLFARDKLEHIKFGTVNGNDGKRFRTREGGVMRLADLIVQARKAAAKRLSDAGIAQDITGEERAEIANLVGLAAIRFSDLQNVRTTNYIFDLERFMAFEGRTGPYLLYAAVRIKSLLKRADQQGLKPGKITPSEPSENGLVLALDDFDRALAKTEEKRMPHILCDHVYTLAQSFSNFYSECPVLKRGVAKEVQASRLALAKLTLRQFDIGLGLLGIEIPKRM